MALKLNLKGGDSLMVAGSRFTIAGEGYTTIIIEGDIPVLRESEMIDKSQANDLPTRILYNAQHHYLTGEPSFLNEIGDLAKQASAEDREAIADILTCFAQSKPFRAIKLARQLVDLGN